MLRGSLPACISLALERYVICTCIDGHMYTHMHTLTRHTYMHTCSEPDHQFLSTRITVLITYDTI